jgi:Bacterial membrane protein YfhO
MNNRRRWLVLFQLPYLPLWLGPLILMAPVWLAGKAMFWGTPSLQFVPWWYWAWETLRSGHLPLWNPQVGMGAPLLANYQAGLFYPPNWLYFLLAAVGGLSAVAWGQAIMVALHLGWGGIGMAHLVRGLGFGRTAQTVSGLAFGLSTYLVGRAAFLSVMSAVAWLPWILIFSREIARPGLNRRAGLALIICAAFQLLSGHAQTTWYTLLLTGIWTAVWGWLFARQLRENGLPAARRRQAAASLLSLAKLAAFLLWAAALAAVQLLPTAEYLMQSQRAAAVSFQTAMTYSTWPWRFLGLFAPGLFGSPAQGDFWGYASYWEDALYIGVLPALLAFNAILGGFIRRKNPRQPDPFWQRPVTVTMTLVILASALLALGQNTPVFPWLYDNVPTFSMFQAPARFLIWSVFGLALLAGLGAQRWRRPSGRGLYWTRLATAGAVAVALGSALAWVLLQSVKLTFLHATALAGFWGLSAGALSLTAPLENGPNNERNAQAWSWAVSLAISADLIIAGWGLNPGISLDFYSQPSSTAGLVRQMAGGGRVYLPDGDEYVLKFNRFFDLRTYYAVQDWTELRAALLPDIFLLDGLDSANNFDPLVPARYANWMQVLSNLPPVNQLKDDTQAGLPGESSLVDIPPDISSAVFERMLNLMGVRVVERVDHRSPDNVRFSIVPKSSDAQVQSFQGIRLQWATCVLPAADAAQALSLVTAENTDLNGRVILEGAAPPATSGCQTQPPASFDVVGATPNRVEISVRANHDGWLILSDVWYPGWRATIDGIEVPVEKADYLFRGVAVPTGEHLIRFSYQPLSFYLGAVISLVAGLGWLWAFRRT